MTLSLPTIVRCPACPTIFVIEYPASGTTVTEVIWSDGWTEGSGVRFQGQTPVFLCPRCEKWQWIDDATALFEVPFAVLPDGIPELSTFDSLSIEELNNALAQPWPADREKRLRTQLLWLQNHPRRRGEKPKQLSHELMENIERLVELVDPGAVSLFSAELHRELGDFAGAIAALQRRGPPKSISEQASRGTRDQSAQLAELLIRRIEERSIEPFSFAPSRVEENRYYRDFGETATRLQTKP